MTARTFQTGWKVSAKAREFVKDYAKAARMGQAEAADYVLTFLADNPDVMPRPTAYAARIVQEGDGGAFTLRCQESECGEVFNPSEHGNTCESLTKWTEKHKHE